MREASFKRARFFMFHAVNLHLVLVGSDRPRQASRLLGMQRPASTAVIDARTSADRLQVRAQRKVLHDWNRTTADAVLAEDLGMSDLSNASATRPSRNSSGAKYAFESSHSVAVGAGCVCGVACAVALVLFCWICSPVSSNVDVEPHYHVQKVGCLVLMSNGIYLTFVIPDALDIAKSVGQGAVFSGVLIGIINTASALMCLSAWIFDKTHPNVLERYVRWSLIFSIFAPPLGIGFAMGGLCCGTTSASMMLLLGRSLVGASGVFDFTAESFCSKHCQQDVLSEYMLERTVLSAFGLGLGPILNAGARHILRAVSGPSDDMLIELVMMLACEAYAVTLFVLLILKSRSLANTQPAKEGSERETSTQGCVEAPRWMYTVFSSCIIVITCRSFIIAGLEAASAMILEERYAWPLRRIGLIVGGTLLTAEPWRRVFASCRAYWSEVSWLGALLILCFIGTSMLFPALSAHVGLHGEAGLILADLILFPSLVLLTGIVKGIMFRATVPGTWISPANAILSFTVVNELVGRSFGPPLARAALQNGGQPSYAMQQACFLTVACAVPLLVVMLGLHSA